MEVTLIIVTLLSLSLAIGMAIVTWRLLQEERRRADARVALLEEGLAASLAANPPAPLQAQDAATDTPHIIDLPAADDQDWLAQFPSSAPEAVNGSTPHDTAAAREADTARISSAEDLTIDESDETDAIDEPRATTAADRLFIHTHVNGTRNTSMPSRGVLALTAGVAVIAGLILGLWAVGRLFAPGMDQRPIATAAAAAPAPAPLELVAMKQTRDGDSLTISGTVRNPHAGISVDRLAAVVSFFDAEGKQLASARAPLDFRTLAPGDESPFQVTTAVPSGVSRYRVSFRRDEGTIVPHVDRRQQESS